MMSRIILLLICCVVALGCQSLNQETRALPTGSITHVVLVWLKDPADAGARQGLSEAAESFRQIPGVRRVTTGKPVPSQRPGVDASFDTGFVMVFDDESALRAYQDHPVHVKAVREVLTPAVREVKVYDLVAQ